jgi:L-ectoine synthase
MIVRTLNDVVPVEWGNGLSHRLLVAADGLGYSMTDTLVRAGTSSLLEYKSHLEACYCVSGRGKVVTRDGREHIIEPGVLYALDENDPHVLIADDDTDLRLICTFLPALHGHERHSLGDNEYSYY